MSTSELFTSSELGGWIVFPAQSAAEHNKPQYDINHKYERWEKLREQKCLLLSGVHHQFKPVANQIYTHSFGDAIQIEDLKTLFVALLSRMWSEIWKVTIVRKDRANSKSNIHSK